MKISHTSPELNIGLKWPRHHFELGSFPSMLSSYQCYALHCKDRDVHDMRSSSCPMHTASKVMPLPKDISVHVQVPIFGSFLNTIFMNLHSTSRRICLRLWYLEVVCRNNRQVLLPLQCRSLIAYCVGIAPLVCFCGRLNGVPLSYSTCPQTEICWCP